MAIGVKEIIKLGEEKINERFNLRGGKSGFAGEYVLGFLPEGVKAGGFLYTNKDTVSLGVVVSMKDLRKNGSTYSFDIIEEFAEHPYIAPMIEGGKVEEYSAHLVQEGGIQGVPKLYGNGYMIAGDAAGFSFSNGLVLQGMNYAIASGIAAAETAIEAKSKNNFSEEALAAYRERLMNSFVLRDLLDFRGDTGRHLERHCAQGHSQGHGRSVRAALHRGQPAEEAHIQDRHGCPEQERDEDL